MSFPRRRSRELMDAPDADPTVLRFSLSFIERVNRRLGYTRATLSYLERFARGWTAGKEVSILDVATGSADVPRAICDWADRRGLAVRVTGIDRHAATLDFARRACAGERRIALLSADAVALPFDDGAFDYVLSSMFLHHLPDDAAVAALVEMNRVARRGVIVADLSRSRRALAWITLFTLFSNPMVKHDARVSVRGAFTPGEARAMAVAAGLEFCRVHRHFGHRWVLAGERS